MIEILRGSYIEVVSIKNLLESHNISVFIGNEYISTIQPWSISSGGVAPAILKVQENEYEKATKIMDNYNKGEYSLDI